MLTHTFKATYSDGTEKNIQFELSSEDQKKDYPICFELTLWNHVVVHASIPDKQTKLINLTFVKSEKKTETNSLELV